jgi:hypothetical protein
MLSEVALKDLRVVPTPTSKRWGRPGKATG